MSELGLHTLSEKSGSVRTIYRYCSMSELGLHTLSEKSGSVLLSIFWYYVLQY